MRQANGKNPGEVKEDHTNTAKDHTNPTLNTEANDDVFFSLSFFHSKTSPFSLNWYKNSAWPISQLVEVTQHKISPENQLYSFPSVIPTVYKTQEAYEGNDMLKRHPQDSPQGDTWILQHRVDMKCFQESCGHLLHEHLATWSFPIASLFNKLL